jgi:hypothetical protein
MASTQSDPILAVSVPVQMNTIRVRITTTPFRFHQGIGSIVILSSRKWRHAGLHRP